MRWRLFADLRPWKRDEIAVVDFFKPWFGAAVTIRWPEMANSNAHVAELVDAHDSGSCGETRGGSSPLVSTFFPVEGGGSRSNYGGGWIDELERGACRSGGARPGSGVRAACVQCHRGSLRVDQSCAEPGDRCVVAAAGG